LADQGACRAENPGGYFDAIVDSVIIGSVISTLEIELSLLLFLRFPVVDDRSAVAVTMIYMPLTSFLSRVQEDGKVMERFPS
jgi:hypothetical protein